MDATQRMIPLSGGRRAGITLDQATWRAIEWLAEQEGKTWRQWCASVIEATPADKNTTAAVRAAAMDRLLFERALGGRRDAIAAMQAHPLLKDSGTLNDQQLEDILRGATVQGWSDFGGFAIGFGQDEHGQECIWIRNALRHGLHFALVLPINEKGSK